MIGGSADLKFQAEAKVWDFADRFRASSLYNSRKNLLATRASP
jgi:hypothetical protein